MYEIYVDGEILYHPHLATEGYGVFSPKITMELNKSGSLTFVLPTNNLKYDSIKKLKSVITVLQDGIEIFRGRVLNDEKDFYNRKNVYCEGELSYFLDSVRRPYTFSGTVSDLFKQYVDNHNSQVDDWKKFNIGDISDCYNDISITFETSEYEKTFDAMTNLLINNYGGYLRTRLKDGIRYIDYVKELGSDHIDTINGVEVYGKKASQMIQFGVNLLDISEYISADDVFTVLIPIGADGLTIASYTNGQDYIEDESAVALFGKIWRTQIWDDIKDRDILKTTAEKFLKTGIEMAVSLTVSAIDLHIVNVDTEKINLGDHVRVVSLPHNLDKYFQCIKMVIDLVNADQNEYSFGLSYTTLTERQSNETKAVQNSVIIAQTTASHANQKVQQVESVVTQIPDKYVSNKVFDDAMSQESIFDILTNGGSIDGIMLDKTTGDIYINASYIKSGTLNLGGTSALLKIVNGKGEDCVTLDDDGIHILEGEVNATSGSLKNVSIDMNGEPITNVKLPKNNTDAANKEYVDTTVTNAITNVELPENAATKEYVDGKSTTFKMIWSNGNQAAEFEPQSIVLDTSKYNDICIRCRYSNNYGYEQTTFILGSSGGCVFGECQTKNGTTMSRACRYFERSNDTITVDAGFKDGTLNNNYCIPIAIYGINW